MMSTKIPQIFDDYRLSHIKTSFALEEPRVIDSHIYLDDVHGNSLTVGVTSLSPR